MSTKKPINLNDLSPADKKKLLTELKQQQKAEGEKVTKARNGYKDLVNKKVPSLFVLLQDSSQSLAKSKKAVYKELQSLVAKKSEVYDREQDQTSHTFTTADGISITIGYRMMDGWDDTVTVGLQKVHDYINSFGKDRNSKALVKTILTLLAKDSTGNLKASRVLQLKKMAAETKNKGFIDAVQIIQDAYRPKKTKQFVTCRYTEKDGSVKELPLNISDVELT